MLTLFFSPHSASVDNERGHASGFADVPLAPSGEKQACELAKHYQAIGLDAIFSSDLQRASRTSELIFADRRLPIYLDARLRELDYGELSQYPTEQIKIEMLSRIREPFPGGESIAQAVQRVGDCLMDILRYYDGKSVAIIGHRATKYGIEYLHGYETLDALVQSPWEWLDVPIWRYEFDVQRFDLRK